MNTHPTNSAVHRDAVYTDDEFQQAYGDDANTIIDTRDVRAESTPFPLATNTHTSAKTDHVQRGGTFDISQQGGAHEAFGGAVPKQRYGVSATQKQTHAAHTHVKMVHDESAAS